MKKNVPVSKTMKLSELKSHPHQDLIFAKPTEKDIQRLAHDIEDNGLQHPPDVLSDGTLLRGHSRCRALKFLGHEETVVNVRYDLADKGEQELLDFLVDDNLNRRQLTPLETARCALVKLGQMKALTDGCETGRVTVKLKNRIAKDLGMSRRNLDRLLALLDAPMEVQNALVRGYLTMETASKIIRLSKEDQSRVVAIINQVLSREAELGGEVAEAMKVKVAKFLQQFMKPRKGRSGMVQLVKALEQACVDFDNGNRFTDVRSDHWKQKLPLFKTARILLKKLEEHVNKPPRNIFDDLAL